MYRRFREFALKEWKSPVNVLLAMCVNPVNVVGDHCFSSREHVSHSINNDQLNMEGTWDS